MLKRKAIDGATIENIIENSEFSVVESDDFRALEIDDSTTPDGHGVSSSDQGIYIRYNGDKRMKLTSSDLVIYGNLQVPETSTINNGASNNITFATDSISASVAALVKLTIADEDVTFYTPVIFPSGAAATPAITFTGDTNTGIYRSAANTLRIVGDGTAIATFFGNSIGDSYLQLDQQLRAASGSLSLPSVSFTGDTDTGLYNPSANNISIVSNGSSVATISPSTITTNASTMQVLADSTTALRVQSANGNFTYFTVSTSTGQALFGTGTAAAPSIAFAADANTGIYRIGADDFGISVGGSQVIRLTGAGVAMQIPVNLKSYTVAGVPSGVTGDIAYITNGDAGSPCLGVYDGTAWKRISLGATISAT